MKLHLKRYAAPTSWLMKRKEAKFVMRPKPGAHSLRYGLPLSLVLREMLGFAQNAAEATKILQTKEIIVDGKVRKEPRFIVGLMDVISIPVSGEHYRILLDGKGRLFPMKIDEKESNVKICKVKGKMKTKKGVVQISLHDGRSILTDKEIKVGDSVVINPADNKIKQVLELKKGAYVYMARGKHAGDKGVMLDTSREKIIYERADKKKVETLKDYVFVVGEDKPLVRIENES